jgi:hypothetical protein
VLLSLKATFRSDIDHWGFRFLQQLFRLADSKPQQILVRRSSGRRFESLGKVGGAQTRLARQFGERYGAGNALIYEGEDTPKLRGR